MSRPSVRCPEIEAAIVEKVASGVSLREVARDPAMPAEGTIRGWAAADPTGFGEHLRQAREASAEYWDQEAETVLRDAIADRDIPPTREEVAILRELSQVFRWRARVYAPRVYGDRVDVNVTGTIAIAEQLAEVRQRRAIIEGVAEPMPAGLPAPAETEETAA